MVEKIAGLAGQGAFEEEQSSHGFCISKFATLGSLEGLRYRQLFNLQILIGIGSQRRRIETGSQEDGVKFIAVAGGKVKAAQVAQLGGSHAYFFANFTRSARFGALAGLQHASRQLEQFTIYAHAVLADKPDLSVAVQRNDGNGITVFNQVVMLLIATGDTQPEAGDIKRPPLVNDIAMEDFKFHGICSTWPTDNV